MLIQRSDWTRRRIASARRLNAVFERVTGGWRVDVAEHERTLADEIEGVTNLHFREEVYDGRMVFDYRLRPGPCPTTNALTIMRLEGLPVES